MPAINPRPSSPSIRPDQSGKPALTVTLTLSEAQLDAIAERVVERLPPSPPECSAPWLDTAGAAAYLAAKPSRIHDLVQRGELTPRRDGRRLVFRRSALDAYLEASR